jgi:hypothetical protein
LGKQWIGQQIGAEAVLEDHLGITVFPTLPRPSFVRTNITGKVSKPAEALVEDLRSIVGQRCFLSSKAETAAAIYAFSHFVGPAPARFLMLFVALEALFKREKRSFQWRNHIEYLAAVTKASDLSSEDMQSLLSELSLLHKDSIGSTGRRFDDITLGEQLYDSLLPGPFFIKIYKVRNNLVHRGRIEPETMHVLVGEVDRFVADIVSRQTAA